jgi:histidinol phosphatase-like enzyme
MLGHNNGPPIDEPTDKGSLERAYSWRQAHKAIWRTPSVEVVKIRMRAAEDLGMSYKDYTAILMDRGRAPNALFFELAGTLVRTRNNEIAVDNRGEVMLMPGVREKLSRLGDCSVFVIGNQARIRAGSLTASDFETCVKQVSDQTRRTITDHCLSDAGDEKSPLRLPAPGMVLHLLNKHLLQPARAVLIGDTIEHEECARRASLARFIWSWRYFADPAPAPT